MADNAAARSCDGEKRRDVDLRQAALRAAHHAGRLVSRQYGLSMRCAGRQPTTPSLAHRVHTIGFCQDQP